MLIFPYLQKEDLKLSFSLSPLLLIILTALCISPQLPSEYHQKGSGQGELGIQDGRGIPSSSPPFPQKILSPNQHPWDYTYLKSNTQNVSGTWKHLFAWNIKTYKDNNLRMIFRNYTSKCQLHYCIRWVELCVHMNLFMFGIFFWLCSRAPSHKEEKMVNFDVFMW